jgi:uncharacterized secreted protein with C-terminal beta-propeller domain
MYVSQNHVYISGPSGLASAYSWAGSTDTDIHRFRIRGGSVEYACSARVPGTILDQFSMDEFRGHLRVATHAGTVLRMGVGSATNSVYVLDDALNITGGLTGLAPGEYLHSVRFMGERAYLVTFKKVDPLFVIGLADPAAPTLLGALKIPGFSDYLHPWSEHLLIGVGLDTVEAEEGNFAWFQGVKVSLFDVSDPTDPRELSTLVIGHRGSNTPVRTDHHAFLPIPHRGLAVLPVSVSMIEEPNGKANQGGVPVWQGAYVLDISENLGIQVMGTISHGDGGDCGESYYWGADPSYPGPNCQVDRALYIGDVLYTLSPRLIKANSLLTLATLGRLSL